MWRPLLCLTMLGCSTIPVVEPEPTVKLAPAVEQFIGMLHPRMEGHATLPNAEILMCLFGHVKGSEVHVTGIAPTILVDVTAVSLRYRGCPVGAIGTWHTHPVVPGYNTCGLSNVDKETFYARPQDLVMLVSCVRDDTVRVYGAVKRGYSRR